MGTILGLDLGPHSIGWALINPDIKEIISTGVRIFEEGINRSGGREKSKNAARRSARQSRRMNARSKARRNKLVYILTELGMYPENGMDTTNYFKENPYSLRTRGLDEKLSLFELGRVLYHLNQRRGFKSNRKTDKESEKGVLFKGNDDKTGIDETSQGMQAGGFRTLGEYLNSLDPHLARQRNRYTLRSMYIDEFNKLWDKQSEYQPEILTVDSKADIFKTIFFQRRLKSQKGLVRNCTFEPNKKVSPKSSPVYQYFRILEQCSRIRITDGERIDTPLTVDEHKTLVNELSHRDSLKIERIIKLLGLSETAHINLQSLDKLKGNTTNYQFSRVFGKSTWQSFTPERQYEIWHTIHFYNDPPDDKNWLENHAHRKWGLDDKTAKKLYKVKLEPDYGRLSNKAMLKVIPYFEQVLDENGRFITYDKAVKAAGYHHSQVNQNDGAAQRLPIPDNLRNPIVQKALFELRTVVNEIINKYGKANEIRVELARDTKLPKWKRNGLLKLNRQREQKAIEIKKRLIEDRIITDPKRDDIIKYLLWEECNQTCPYTGKHISLSALFSSEFEIEHIIPYSRSLDDSQANKTLCYWKENQIKHNQTPWESYGHDTKRFEEIMVRVFNFQNVQQAVRITNEIGMVKNRNNFKYKKFQLKKIPDDFIARQLVDTAYISREVSKYLTKISDKVYVTPGRVTGTLRYLWGLNQILSGDVDIKQREDHRHHAVDALVIAATTHSFVNTMSRYHSYDRKPGRERFPMPWSTFSDGANRMVNNVLVSHRVKDRPRGQLHEETNYGQITLPNGEKSYVVRKPLTALTANQIRHIVDPVIRQVILNRLNEIDVDTNDKFKIPKEAFLTPLYPPGSKNPLKKVRVAVTTKEMLQLYPNRKLFVEYGSNHHVEIFENKDGKRIGRFISLFEAVQRHKNGLPLIDISHPNGLKFIMSLSINEMILMDVNENDIDWNDPPSAEALGTQLYRVQKMTTTGTITFRHHTVSLTDSPIGLVFKTPNTLRGIKVLIDSTGTIGPTNQNS